MSAMTRTSLAILFLLAVAAAPPTRVDKQPAKSAHQPRGGEWEVVFADDITVEEYARQLDYFKIEIAAVSKNGKIEYISNVSQRKPEKRLGHTTADYRLHIGWKKGQLHAADRKLLAKAGISSGDKELWHFFQTETQAQLATLERTYADRSPSEIKRTRFEIRPADKGDGYEFVVIEQDPPKPSQPESTSASSPNQPERKSR
jgi:hypothetical protein